MGQLKTDLKYIKLVEFPGQNFTNFLLKISYYFVRLDNYGYWDEQLLDKLAKIFKSCTEEQFRPWDLTNINKTIKYIENFAFQSITSIP